MLVAGVAAQAQDSLMIVLAGGERIEMVWVKGGTFTMGSNEGSGVSRLVREACDMTASIPMKGKIDSLNASVAAGVLCYEIVRQRLAKAGNL